MNKEEALPVELSLIRRELMPDGSVGAVYIRQHRRRTTTEIRLTLAQAEVLVGQITERIEKARAYFAA